MGQSLLELFTTISKDGPCREKTLRALGSLFKAVNYYAERRDPSLRITKVSKMLAVTISEARRVYRQCKYIECISSLLRTLQHKSPVLRVILSGRYIALAMHHMLDQIVFFHAMGLFRDTINKDLLNTLKKRTLAAWWISIWFQLAADFYLYYCDYQLACKIKQEGNEKLRSKLETELQTRKKAHFRLFLDIVKNVFDFPVAMEGALKRGTFTTGQTGLCGAISSVVALYLLYPKK